MANTLLFDDALIDRKPEGDVRLRSLEPQMWESDPARVASVYELLCAAHYRTSPLDLRRMMDAPASTLRLHTRGGYGGRALAGGRGDCPDPEPRGVGGLSSSSREPCGAVTGGARRVASRGDAEGAAD